MRTEFWGYAADERLDNEDLIEERYAGIRPAPGYPACPDHTEKQTLWELLDVEETTGIDAHRVRWRCGRAPRCSGWYFSPPAVAVLRRRPARPDQVEDYAARKGWTLAEAERWLSPNLGYDPED